MKPEVESHRLLFFVYKCFFCMLVYVSQTHHVSKASRRQCCCTGSVVTDRCKFSHGHWCKDLGSLESNQLSLLSYFSTHSFGWRILFIIRDAFVYHPPIAVLYYLPCLLTTISFIHQIPSLLIAYTCTQGHGRETAYCISTNGIIIKRWYIYTMEFYSAIQKLKL